jgi:hypothetical protein
VLVFTSVASISWVSYNASSPLKLTDICQVVLLGSGIQTGPNFSTVHHGNVAGKLAFSF